MQTIESKDGYSITYDPNKFTYEEGGEYAYQVAGAMEETFLSISLDL